LKLTALIILAITFLLTGQYVNLRMKKRVNSLNSLIILIESINSQISFSQKNIMQIIEESVSDGKKDLKMISELIKRQDSDFAENWKKTVELFGKDDCLNSEDKKILCSFGNELGVTDLEGQSNNCRLHIDLLKKQLDSAVKTVREKTRMNTAISLFLASVSVIIFY